MSSVGGLLIFPLRHWSEEVRAHARDWSFDSQMCVPRTKRSLRLDGCFKVAGCSVRRTYFYRILPPFRFIGSFFIIHPSFSSINPPSFSLINHPSFSHHRTCFLSDHHDSDVTPIASDDDLTLDVSSRKMSTTMGGYQ